MFSITKEAKEQTLKIPSTVRNSASIHYDIWLVAGVRVRIISKKVGGDKLYLMKGTIVDVHGAGVASMILDDGQLLSNVKQKHLETVLPAIAGECILLNGQYKGERATLIEKDKASETVLVQLVDDLSIISISMDFVASYQ